MNTFFLNRISAVVILGLIFSGVISVVKAQQFIENVEWSKLQGPQLAQIKFEKKVTGDTLKSVRLDPPIAIDKIEIDADLVNIYSKMPFRLDTHYHVIFPDGTRHFLVPDGILDDLYSEKPLGCRMENNRLIFRLFAPRAKWVKLVLFDQHDAQSGDEFLMKRDADGVWEFADSQNRALVGKYYGYRVHGPQGNGEMFDSTLVLADPYSQAVVSQNHFTHPAKTLILPKNEPFDWENTQRVDILPRDLIVYEMHVRDMTAHPTSGVAAELRGSYTGLVNENQRGGLPYLKNLGINAVELLPVQDFGNIEIPYRDSTIAGYPTNTWNPYARNHWGYMTSYFFAPESYYASGGNMRPGEYNGTDGRQVREFKEMVKAFHSNQIAVILDVVYNHVSQYDHNPYKYIDKFYYFRLKPNCDFESASGCGNDFKTERPMARRMIVESVLHWMKEYRIDGFRFDLAAMIDWGTIEAIRNAARKINPNVHLIAEPWGGGGYAPATFSEYGWGSWNDQIRNGFKGWNPHDDAGFIFGKWKNGVTQQSLQNYVMGTLREYGGLFLEVGHAINYLESHDDHTLGDFIRLALGEVREDTVITDVDAHAKLSPAQLKTNKLAAMALLTSQGGIMLHSGQEFARSKVIAKTDVPDLNIGKIDHNSYDKDNETNWLNYDHADANAVLIDYYRGLIDIRKSYSAFRHANPENIRFLGTNDPLLLAYEITVPGQNFLVVLNGNPEKNHRFTLPPGDWVVMADAETVHAEMPKPHTGLTIAISATSGVILKRIR